MGTINLQIWINRIMLGIGAIAPYRGLGNLPEINYPLIIGGPIICIICINKLLELERLQSD